jgi:tight adherence protein C
MMLLFLISGTITIFLLVAILLMMLGGEEAVEARLMEIAAPQLADSNTLEAPRSDLAKAAASLTGAFKPIRDIISGSDDDLEYRLASAGFRKPEHIQVYMAIKMLLPVLGIVAGTFFGGNMIAAIMVGAVIGFFGPDFVISRLVSRRLESISHALPDALDLLVICLEAGLGIDQAMVRVAEEMRLTSPPLADEFQIINREQRAGKPRLEAWRSMAARVDVDFVRQFVSMLVQTERYGTPIAQALGSFADNMRVRRTQAAEEMAAKTGVKLLFPLILFIFPSIFVVSLGPAILGIQKVFQEFNR